MYVLGIDVGTTGTKAILVDEEGRILSKGYKGYGLLTPGQGRVEQDARLWWDAVIHAVREACATLDTGESGRGAGRGAASHVTALSLSTQGASSLLVNEDFEPLTMALTWMDGRAGPEAAELAEKLGPETVYRRTGWLPAPSLDAAKLLWLDRHEGALVKRAAKWVSTLEFINWKLTGRAVIDPTNAGIRQLMNLGTLDWDEAVLAAVGADAAILPEIRPSGEYLGELGRAASEALGLPRQVRVYNGAHDQYCACLGASITRPGEILLSTGTSWVLMAATEAPLFSPSHISPAPHIEKGLWGALAALGTAGAALEWFRGKFLDEDYSELARRLDSGGGGPGELLFFPFLAGGGFPLRTAKARASFVGLGLEHDRYDAAKAVMEGVVYQMRLSLEEYSRSGCELKVMRVAGGALNSPFWLRAIAGNAPCPVCVMSETDTACVGAAAMAGVGIGMYPDYRSAAARMNRSVELALPSEAESRAWGEGFERFNLTWERLATLYE